MAPALVLFVWMDTAPTNQMPKFPQALDRFGALAAAVGMTGRGIEGAVGGIYEISRNIMHH